MKQTLALALLAGGSLLLASACAGVKRSPGSIPVSPVAQTTPVPSAEDAADDPAIYRNVTGGDSYIIGTNKQRGLEVYGLDGRRLHEYPIGRVNNVDIRYGFPLNGELVDIVVAENRTDMSLSINRLDPATGALTNIGADPVLVGLEVYGSGLYQSKKTGRFFSFVGSKPGVVQQLELVATEDGRVTAKPVRQLVLSTQVEGIVADDEAGRVFVGEEMRGVWSFDAEPDASTEGTLISEIATGNPIKKGDVEGLSIYDLGNGQGYLIASSQGSYEYVVFDREPPHAHLGTFHIGPQAKGVGTIDGAEETDGIAVEAGPIRGAGLEFPAGIFVAQDGYNKGGLQNFKIVDWAQIAASLDLRTAQ